MNAAPKSSMAWAKPRILLSFLSVLAGWGSFMIYCLLQVLIKPVYGWENPWAVLLVMGLCSGVVVLVVWAILLVPLVLLIPSRSVLWKPAILASIGIFAGPIIIAIYATCSLLSNSTIKIYQPYQYILGGLVFPGLPSALIGGVTGAVAARLHQRLLRKELTPGIAK